MLNKNGKVFGKINIIDFGIIVLVLAFAAGVFLKFCVLDQTKTSTTNETINFTVKIAAVRNLYYEQIKVGDAVFDPETENQLGVVTAITKEAAEIGFVDKNGQSKLAPAEGRYDIHLTIEGEGSVTDGHYLLNKTYEIGLGSSKTLSTKFVSFHVLVEEISGDESQ